MVLVWEAFFGFRVEGLGFRVVGVGVLGFGLGVQGFERSSSLERGSFLRSLREATQHFHKFVRQRFTTLNPKQ